MLSFYLLVTWQITYLAGHRTRKQFYLCVDSGIKCFNYQYKIISFFYRDNSTCQIEKKLADFSGVEFFR